MKRALLWLIRFYRSAISPRKPAMCKYIPTCSQYGLEAIERFGAFKGGLLTLWSILRSPLESPRCLSRRMSVLMTRATSRRLPLLMRSIFSR